MFVTSITTAGAFAANAFSPIAPIRLFGIFMAAIVIANFLLVSSYYPALLSYYTSNCEHRCPALVTTASTRLLQDQMHSHSVHHTPPDRGVLPVQLS